MYTLNCRLQLRYLLPLIALGTVVGASAHAVALTVSLNQKILPMNCVFTTINAGTGELNYVTPEACGIYVSLPSQSVSGAAQQPSNLHIVMNGAPNHTVSSSSAATASPPKSDTSSGKHTLNTGNKALSAHAHTSLLTRRAAIVAAGILAIVIASLVFIFI